MPLKPPTGLFAGAEISASALSAERLRMTVASENLANAGSTRRLDDGMPYKRQRVVFETVMDREGNRTGQVQATVVDDARYSLRNDPTHPDADANGMVAVPEISPILELTDLLVASKTYEANANAMRGFLKMHENALRIGQA
ncbi:MAG: flagellar basal-body rod protein FlgC [Planctomycetota bacterium]|jgi:flagellar basal-body rod protein FlgC